MPAPEGSYRAPYISQIYEIYRSLIQKNSHATASMMKAWGLVGNLPQVRNFGTNVYVPSPHVLNSAQRLVMKSDAARG